MWGAAVITAVLFFVSLLAHELAHSLVARAHKLPVRRITLFALGGVSVIEKEAADATTEFLIAIVGPLTSVVLGAAMFWSAKALAGNPDAGPQTPSIAILYWLGTINLGLGVFNMLPGFPLDGGRVLRALAWWITGSMDRATMIAARTGQGMAFIFIALGISQSFRGAGLNGLWITLHWLVPAAGGGRQLPGGGGETRPCRRTRGRSDVSRLRSGSPGLPVCRTLSISSCCAPANAAFRHRPTVSPA